MRRALAPILAAVLAALPAAVAAEPLDLDLARLGAPSAEVQAALAGRRSPSAEDVQAAADARQRFALLSSEVALAFSSPLLEPASTPGHAGFDVGLEVAHVGVHRAVVGGVDDWPTRGQDPSALTLGAVHVRKGLPFSFELGGRLLTLTRSSYVGGQLEARWALEGLDGLPAVAVRGAWTEVLGQKDWNLGTGELDLIVSRRWPVGRAASLTPYLAARLAWVRASSDPIAFAPEDATDPAAAARSQAAFPSFTSAFYRTTLGARMTAALASLSAEVSWLAGSTHGRSSPAADGYPRHRVPSSLAAALRAGLEF
jgi:hypothetical protein